MRQRSARKTAAVPAALAAHRSAARSVTSIARKSLSESTTFVTNWRLIWEMRVKKSWTVKLLPPLPDKPPLKRFHMVECMQREGAFLGWYVWRGGTYVPLEQSATKGH
jgi:hypothetical protein